MSDTCHTPRLSPVCDIIRMRETEPDAGPRQGPPEFDMDAFWAATDAARRDRNLSWVDLASAINEPFRGTPSIPISVSTLRGMRTKRSVTSAVVLQVLRWLGRAPESFLTLRNGVAEPCETLPEPGPSRLLRFDTQSIHAALDTERRRRGLTWKQVADELPGFTPGTLTNLASGPLIGFPRVMLITQWLRCPATRFVRARAR